MIIHLGNSAIECNEAEELVRIGTGKTVYCIDERDDIYHTPEQAMDDAEVLFGTWIGNLCVCEYKVNITYNDEDGRYELVDNNEAPLSFTGRYWTHTDDGWKEEA